MISIIIPVKDESASLTHLYKELLTVVEKLRKPYEILFVNDGSSDGSKDTLDALARQNRHVSVAHFRANFGKSEALAYGFSHTKGEVVVMLDADLQDDPHDIPKLLSKLHEGYDLVVGWRKERKDTMDKRISSYFFNVGTRLLSGVRLHDYNCGLKVMKQKLARELHLHGELHRFIPVLAAKLKYRVTEVQIHHRARRYGSSKFGLGRSWRAAIDLMTVLFLTHYEGKPAHFFGLYGILLFFAGFLMDGYVAYIRFMTGTTQHHIPLLLAGILCMVLGVQLVSIGLITELIITLTRHEPDYL